MKTLIDDVEHLMSRAGDEPVWLDANTWADSGYIFPHYKHLSHGDQLIAWARDKGWEAQFVPEKYAYRFTRIRYYAGVDPAGNGREGSGLTILEKNGNLIRFVNSSIIRLGNATQTVGRAFNLMMLEAWNACKPRKPLSRKKRLKRLRRQRRAQWTSKLIYLKPDDLKATLYESMREKIERGEITFNREHLGIPYQPTQAEMELQKLARQYHERTEAFDQAHCHTRTEAGIAMPTTHDEIIACSRHALQVRCELELAAARLGFSPRQWKDAIRRELHT